jgi:hypothetical protein
MSKKRKRQENLVHSPSSKSVTSLGGSLRASSTEFNPDYSYVRKDLRRIGILAGTFISLLILLSFFLR